MKLKLIESVLAGAVVFILEVNRAMSADWYVSPSATPAGTGSIIDPWNMSTALAHPAAVKPGDTIWLRGGTYQGAFNSYLSGSSNTPIVVRSYRGEWAKIDGRTVANPAILNIGGGHTWYWGFEVMSSDADRVSSESTLWPTDMLRQEGIMTQSSNPPGIRLINMVVHDTRQGLNLKAGASDLTLYGCVVYHNGWTAPDGGHGYGIYAQNQNGFKAFSDNIVYGGFTSGLYIYGSSSTYLNNFRVERNMLFNAGILQESAACDLMLGGLAVLSGARVHSNCVYTAEGQSNESLNLGFWPCGAGSSSARIFGNYFGRGAVYVHTPYTGLIFAGNTLDTTTLGGISSQAYPDNRYRSSLPSTNVVAIYPNQYESNRANIAVYNWTNGTSVTVTLPQGLLSDGDLYSLRNVQNYFGDVIRGTNTNSTLIIPMTGRTVAAPVGWSAPPSLFPRFGAFVLERTGHKDDQDRDGLPDSWERTYFGSTNSPTGKPADDPDKDGHTNMMEYEAGTIPTSASSVLSITDIYCVATNKAVVRWQSAPGRSYVLRRTPSLKEGIQQTVQIGIPSTPPVNTYTDNYSSIPACFYCVDLE